MNIRGDVRNLQVMRRWLSHLALFVFIARSLVPVGFMPDFTSGKDGAFRIVICTGYGTQTVDLDANGHKLPAKPGASHHQPCAFSASSAVADLPLVAMPVEDREFASVLAHAVIFDVLPPARAGPAVGSRAPPQIS